jgi:hypothetical protein
MDWVQWLALTGGLAAALTFVANRWDHARSDSAAVYAVVTHYLERDPIESTYEVHNDGPLPILWVYVYVWDGDASRRITWRLRLPDSWMTDHGAQVDLILTIRPGHSTEERPLPPPVRDPDRPAEFRVPGVMLIFLDGRGRRWVRWPDGSLSSTRLATSATLGVRVVKWRNRRDRKRRGLLDKR